MSSIFTVSLDVFSDSDRLLGKTTLPSPSEEGEQASMELGSMANDLISLLKTVFPSRDEAPALILVGHSMVRSLFSLINVIEILMSSGSVAGWSGSCGSLQSNSRFHCGCTRSDSDRRRRR